MEYKVNENYLKKVLSLKKSIIVDQKLVEAMGFDDMRDFAEALHSWGHCRDFTYSKIEYNWQKFLRQFIKEYFLEQI